MNNLIFGSWQTLKILLEWEFLGKNELGTMIIFKITRFKEIPQYSFRTSIEIKKIPGLN